MKLETSNFPRAFTLIELLVVIGVISVLAALSLPVVATVVLNSKITRARTEMRLLATGLVGYQAAYGRFPIQPAGASDLTFGYPGGGTASNSDLVVILMDLNLGPNVNHAANPRQLTFYSPQQHAYDTSSPGMSDLDHQIRDPWGHPYIITLDTDGDKRCRDAFYGSSVVSRDSGQSGYNNLSDNGSGFFELNAPVMIWSLGPDGKCDPSAKANAGANHDNIIGW